MMPTRALPAAAVLVAALAGPATAQPSVTAAQQNWLGTDLSRYQSQNCQDSDRICPSNPTTDDIPCQSPDDDGVKTFPVGSCQKVLDSADGPPGMMDLYAILDCTTGGDTWATTGFFTTSTCAGHGKMLCEYITPLFAASPDATAFRHRGMSVSIAPSILFGSTTQCLPLTKYDCPDNPINNCTSDAISDSDDNSQFHKFIASSYQCTSTTGATAPSEPATLPGARARACSECLMPQHHAFPHLLCSVRGFRASSVIHAWLHDGVCPCAAACTLGPLPAAPPPPPPPHADPECEDKCEKPCREDHDCAKAVMGHDKKCPSKVQDMYNCYAKCSVTGDKSEVEKKMKQDAKDQGCSDPYAMSTVA
eukprot:COSAG01_NODE_13564_length_1567_cov_1.157357_1_plen_363_part_10